MYTRYFGLDEKPFTLTPNPRFIFLSSQHREAFAHLLYGINGRHGFIELTGEVGTGKTTVLRTLLGQLQNDDYRTALIFNPCLTIVEFLQGINQEYGIESEGLGITDLLNTLNRFLLEENARGRTVVLVIDEAQNLRPEVLEQLRLISNLETENDKLIQIILAGQPELEKLLQRHNLRQLNQRIAVRYRLKAMASEETGAYIRRRLEVAGARGGASFTPLATRLIHLYSGGAPRMINIVCDRALLSAYADGSRTVTLAVVLRAMNELRSPSRARRTLFRFAPLLVLLFLIGMYAGTRFPALSSSPFPHRAGAVILPLPQRPVKTVSIKQNADPAPEKKPSQAKSGTTRDLERTLRERSLNQAHIDAFNALMTRWGSNPIRIFKGTLSIPRTFSQLAAKRGLRCTPFHGSLEEAIRFGLPFLASTRVTDEKGRLCLAVTSANGRSLTISPPLPNGGTIAREQLRPLLDGSFYLLWRDSSRIPALLRPGEKRSEVRALQRQLKRAGVFHGSEDGTYGTATIRALHEFQRSHGIPINDSGGELTLALLSRHDAGQGMPTLSSR